MHWVSEKTQDQLDLHALHWMRSRLVSKRTATINQIRAFLLEHAITFRTGASSLDKSLFVILQNHKDEISPRMRDIIAGLYEDWLGVTSREVVRLFLEQLRFELVPFFHGLQWRFAA